MDNPCVIPTNFVVPKGFRHEYLLFYGSVRVARIHGRQGLREIHFETWDQTVKREEALKFSSKSMDWMAQSVEHLRYLCEGDA